jgi:nucleoside-diphosphate-sugar epimerase
MSSLRAGKRTHGRERGSELGDTCTGLMILSGFCYIDARDCAQAFRLAVEKPLIGAHVFNIANADTCFRQPTAELAKAVFPNIAYTPDTKDPREGLISIKKAREVLGFEPKYEWQEEVKKSQK